MGRYGKLIIINARKKGLPGWKYYIVNESGGVEGYAFTYQMALLRRRKIRKS